MKPASGARQTLIDIYPRPGHSYIGSAVLGLHMPVWSVVIAFAILVAFAIKFAALGRLARILSLYVVAICLINFGSVILQCGWEARHTSGYGLLSD